MELQVAIDLLSTQDALRLLDAVAPYVDIIEAGTPLIKQEGLAVVRAIKDAYPNKKVFADMKTMDAGALEAELAFDAGADLVTVLGVAADSTVRGALEVAERYHGTVVVDLIGVPDRVRRARELALLGVQMIELHVGLDEQAASHYSLEQMLEAGRLVDIRFSVAGGLDAARMPAVEAAGASVAVSGAAIYLAPDPAAAARGMRATMRPAA
jgi:3-hexulose-6-phosphate synthase